MFTYLPKRYRSFLLAPHTIDAALAIDDSQNEFVIYANNSNSVYTVHNSNCAVLLRADIGLDKAINPASGKQNCYWECANESGIIQGVIEQRGILFGLLTKSYWYRTEDRDFLVFRRHQRLIESRELGIGARHPKLYSSNVEAILSNSQHIGFPIQLLLVYMYWQESLPT